MVEGEVELQDVDHRFAEEAEHPALGVVIDRLLDGGTSRPRALATRAACRRALATEMSGSSPEPDAVTASIGTGASAASPLSWR